MCGIAGQFSYAADRQPIDRASLRAASERLAARGPDGESVWISPDGSIGFAHRRLAVIDLSENGRQPMLDPLSGNVIVFNGEIYNYRTLRAELEAAGHAFHTNSDTEVVLVLYRLHGADCVHKLRGMFAFAMWNPSQRSLFLARDPFGIKPLYVADDGKVLHFASQVKALTAAGVSDAPCPAGHAGFFLWGHLPEPFTLFRHIRAVPAGSTIEIGAGGVQRTTRYFDLPRRVEALEPFAAVHSPQDARRLLGEALRDSVRHHFVADVPVSLLLSSGLDSTTLTGLATETGQAGLGTITLGFDEYRGSADDEVPLAEACALHYGTDQTTSRISRDAFLREQPRILDAMDQPSIDGINTYLVAKVARDAGYKVALSGVGGDELFAGYEAFRAIPQLVRYAHLPSRIGALGVAFRAMSQGAFSRFTSPKYAGLLEFGGTLAGAYLLRQALFMPWEIEGILAPELAREGLEELDTIRSLEASVPQNASDRIKLCALFTGWYMRNQLLRDADWAGMAHGLEIRTPLVDLPLWETVMRLALSGMPAGKPDMAATLARPLPRPILDRRKTGFSVPIRQWQEGDPAPGAGRTRGLRGWALAVYRQAGFSDAMAA